MSQFNIRVREIAYGCTDIKLLINDQVITCNAGYIGPKPLYTLIKAW